MMAIDTEPDPKCPHCGDPRPVMVFEKLNSHGVETWKCPICTARIYQHVYEPDLRGINVSSSEERRVLCLHCQVAYTDAGDDLCLPCRKMSDYFTGGGMVN